MASRPVTRSPPGRILRSSCVTILDRLLGREPVRPAALKAVVDASPFYGIPLSVAGADWHTRAARYLEAYRVGWFYKAGSRISRDVAQLKWILAYEDTEGDNADEIVAAPNTEPWE